MATLQEVLRWPTKLATARITIEGVDDKGVRYRLTLPNVECADAYGVTIVEKTPGLAVDFDPTRQIPPPSRFFIEVNGELQPDPEDEAVFRVEVIE